MTMGLDHSAQCQVMHCDTCSEHLEADGHIDFTAALEFAKSQGWRTYKGPDKEWAHSCPSCTEDFAKSRRR